MWRRKRCFRSLQHGVSAAPGPSCSDMPFSVLPLPCLASASQEGKCAQETDSSPPR